VRTAANRYVLRIGRPGARTEIQVRSELAWLEALRRDTDLVVPTPLPTSSGDVVHVIAGDPPLCAVLFTWVPGRRIRRMPRTRLVAGLGETLARLHAHAERFVPPDPFTGERFTEVWGFGRPRPLYDDAPHSLWSRELRDRIRQRAAEIQAAITRLYAAPEPPLFVHGDLHLSNVKQLNGKLAVLDFDDSLWAYPIQDIGISLQYVLLRWNDPRAVDAFRAGYQRIRPWPAGDVDLFVDARALELLSLSLREPAGEESARRMLTFLKHRLE